MQTRHTLYLAVSASISLVALYLHFTCTLVALFLNYALSLTVCCSLSFEVCFVILFCNFHMPFQLWCSFKMRFQLYVLSKPVWKFVHVWCCGTECDYMLLLLFLLLLLLHSQTVCIISFDGTFGMRERKRQTSNGWKMRNFIVDINVEVYRNWDRELAVAIAITARVCNNTFSSPTRRTFPSRYSFVWMDWQKIRIRLHLIEMVYLTRVTKEE